TPRGCVDRNDIEHSQATWTATSHPSRVRGSKPHAGPRHRARPPRRTPRGCVDRNWDRARRALSPYRRTPRGCVDRNVNVSLAETYEEAVAPLAGAWIETPPEGAAHFGQMVAPLAGAWIETGR